MNRKERKAFKRKEIKERKEREKKRKEFEAENKVKIYQKNGWVSFIKDNNGNIKGYNLVVCRPENLKQEFSKMLGVYYVQKKKFPIDFAEYFYKGRIQINIHYENNEPAGESHFFENSFPVDKIPKNISLTKTIKNFLSSLLKGFHRPRSQNEEKVSQIESTSTETEISKLEGLLLSAGKKNPIDIRKKAIRELNDRLFLFKIRRIPEAESLLKESFEKWFNEEDNMEMKKFIFDWDNFAINKERLKSIVFSDYNSEIKEIAIKKLSDESVLYELITKENESKKIKFLVAGKFRNQRYFKKVFLNVPIKEIQLNSLAKITRSSILKELSLIITDKDFLALINKNLETHRYKDRLREIKLNMNQDEMKEIAEGRKDSLELRLVALSKIREFHLHLSIANNQSNDKEIREFSEKTIIEFLTKYDYNELEELKRNESFFRELNLNNNISQFLRKREKELYKDYLLEILEKENNFYFDYLSTKDYVRHCFRLNFPHIKLRDNYENRWFADFPELKTIDKLVNEGRYDDAYNATLKSLDLHKDSFLFYGRLAQIQSKEKDFLKVKGVCYLGLINSKNNSFICQYLGDIAFEWGQYKLAVLWWIRSCLIQKESNNFISYVPFMQLSYISAFNNNTNGFKILKKYSKIAGDNNSDLNERGKRWLALLVEEEIKQGSELIKQAVNKLVEEFE